MRVLMIHNRYRERGGEDNSSAAEVELLRAAGVECHFHQIDNRDVEKFGAAAAVNAVWSKPAAKEIAGMVRDLRIDVLHVQNFFPQFSPAVHWAAGQAGAAVVQSLRNYRLACVNGQFFREGRICEDCLGRSPVRGIVHKCYRGSTAASGVVAAMLLAHRAIGTWRNRIDRYIAVSNFTRVKMIEAGLPADKVEVKPNFLSTIPARPGAGEGGYFVYVGRLSEEKGIRTMLDAWKTASTPLPPLKLVGTGPLLDFAREVSVSTPRVEILGVREPAEVLDIVSKAQGLLFPSEWYEGHPRVTIEALSVGTPVISSDVGAVTEIVEDGVTGLQFRAGSPADLAGKVRQFADDVGAKAAMRQAARASFLARFTAADNIKLLLGIYGRALETAARMRPSRAN
jgi:glycosyltransferase involved in cell wall biosynthesis